MTIIEILNKKTLLDWFSKEELVGIIKDYVKLKCKEQRKLCSDNSTITTRGESDGYECWDITSVDHDSILNAPEPKFD